MFKTIVSRLFKQSIGPAIVAIAYSLWQHWPIGLSTQISMLFGSFAAAFFLASWFAGQVLRTSKQVHDEERFNTIINRLDGFDAKSLENLKLATIDQIDAQADLLSLQASVKLLVPEHIKAMIYSMHLDQGDPVDAPFVKPWAVSDESLAVGRRMLKEAAERAQK
ncbi:MAG: hypothetical protein HOO95_03235 [Gallionella sp.]|nr:hypothetical protein [Gallionella sp.]